MVPVSWSPKIFEKECMDNGLHLGNGLIVLKHALTHILLGMISRNPIGGPGTGKGECGWIAIEANSDLIQIHPFQGNYLIKNQFYLLDLIQLVWKLWAQNYQEIFRQH